MARPAPPALSPLVRPVAPSAEERAALLAFLRTL
jgi:hypothetical protein